MGGEFSGQVTWLEKKGGEFCEMGGEFSGQVGDCEDP